MQAEQRRLVALCRVDGCAIRRHQFVHFRYDQLTGFEIEYILERSDHPLIRRNTALETDWFDKLFAFSYRRFEIPRDSITQTCDNIIVGCGNLLQMNHVRLSKHRAPASDPGRMHRFHRKFTEFTFDRQIQPRCLLIQK